MAGRSLARMAIVQRARLRLGERHELGDVLHRQAGRHDEDVRRPADLAGRGEIALRVPAQIVVERRTCDEIGRGQQPCVAVGRRARDVFSRDRAVGAGFGFEHDGGVVPLRGHVLREDAAEHVGDRAGPIGNDDADRAVRKISSADAAVEAKTASNRPAIRPTPRHFIPSLPLRTTRRHSRLPSESAVGGHR